MKWHPDPEHTAAWSAVGGVVTITATSATLTLAREPATAHVSSWLVYACGALALLGIYLMIAPLAHWWPWSSGVKPAREDGRSGGGGQRRARLAGGLLVAASIAAALVALVAGGSSNQATVGRLNLDAEQQRGRDLFAQACTSCHTLAAVASAPRVGFSANLDRVMSTFHGSGSDRRFFVLSTIAEGRNRGRGRMPAKLLVGKDAQDVADFVSAVAGRVPSTGTVSTAVHPPREVELNKIALNPSDPASRSTGSAEVFSEGSQYRLTLELEHLPPSNGFSYAVWLVGGDSRLVGELYGRAW
jgi:mono/diheme cytochrome c family protein